MFSYFWACYGALGVFFWLFTYAALMLGIDPDETPAERLGQVIASFLMVLLWPVIVILMISYFGDDDNSPWKG